MNHLKIWKIKKGHDYRIRTRHPWVFSNELLDSPKGILPGEPIELQDIQGHFLARGYGNPHSLISFRAMSFVQKEEFSMSPEYLTERLFKAWKFRHRSGFRKSFRVCYSEADQMPGLILDRYVFEKNNITYQVFSYQLLTSGMDVVFKKNWEAILKSFVQKIEDIGWEHTFVLQRNDVNIRKLEGLLIEDPVILKTVGSEDLTAINIQMQNVMEPDQNVIFNVNLVEGQKTGFFLDQTFNMRLVVEHLKRQKERLKSRKIKILDLCCYMGQWSAQMVCNMKSWGVDCEVHLVDISELALEKARQNLSVYGVDVHTYKKDVLNLLDIPAFASESPSLKFDIVISDPPAFVKNKKDLHPGLAAYTKLNTQAFKLCNEGAVVASCTCSGLVLLEDFKEALRKSILKSGLNARCLAYGGQGFDHPNLMSFPEGYYLKMVLHQVD
ncbi:MAG: methyltransferase domain-containing protein [Bdellovibrionota bacterium]